LPIVTYIVPRQIDDKQPPAEIPVDVAAGVSVLEALERQGLNIPFSCRVGICQSCMMQTDQAVPVGAQQNLSANQIAQGCFLPCVCYPNHPLRIRMKSSDDKVLGQVVSKTALNASVLSLSLQVDFRWFPGQFIMLWREALTGRAYSIASRCDETKITQLHIKRHDQGVVSRWLHDEVSVGDMLSLSLPLGDCFYTDEHHGKPMLMVGVGTGLAPLFGILQEALYRQHNAAIYLYVASGDESGLYYRDELTTLAKQHQWLHYLPTVKRNTSEDVLKGDIVDVVKERHPDLKGYKIFLCGASDVVRVMQRNCFFQGAAVSDILVDAFDSVIPGS